jgi:hypothetical protein
MKSVCYWTQSTCLLQRSYSRDCCILFFLFSLFFSSSSGSEKLFLLLIMFRPMASLSSSRHTSSSFISAVSIERDLLLFLFLLSLASSSSNRSSYLSPFNIALFLSVSSSIIQLRKEHRCCCTEKRSWIITPKGLAKMNTTALKMKRSNDTLSLHCFPVD